MKCKFTLMEHIWYCIKQAVENKNWDTGGLQELFDKSLDTILFKEPVKQNKDQDYSTISRNADIIVGFFNADTSNTKTLHMTIGDQTLPDLEIKPGEFAYIFENTHVFPVITVAFHQLQITTQSYDNLYAIYALISDNDLRRDLSQNKSIARLRSGKVMSMRGIFGYNEFNPDVCKYSHSKTIELPDMRGIMSKIV
jgi:hypothetical protein